MVNLAYELKAATVSSYTGFLSTLCVLQLTVCWVHSELVLQVHQMGVATKQLQEAHGNLEDILSCQSRKSTGLNKKNNDGLVPFSCFGGTLVTPVLSLQRFVIMASVLGHASEGIWSLRKHTEDLWNVCQLLNITLCYWEQRILQ